jgi:hypothetical protein
MRVSDDRGVGRPGLAGRASEGRAYTNTQHMSQDCVFVYALPSLVPAAFAGAQLSAFRDLHVLHG